MTDQTEVVDAEIVDTGMELQVRENFTPAKVVGGIPYLQEYLTLSEAICRTAMVPSALRNKPEETLAVMMYGAELGIGPMQALQQINFIAGKPSAAAELLRALVLESGHQFILTADREVATATCRRKDWDEWQETTFTIADAAAAGLQGDGWTKYTDQMLSARVTSKACRMWFPDVISGMSYVPEEIESFSPRPNPAPATKTRAVKKSVSTPRSAPVQDGLPSVELYEKLKTAFGMLDEGERLQAGEQFSTNGFPSQMNSWSTDQVREGLDIVDKILNTLAPVGDSNAQVEGSTAKPRAASKNKITQLNIRFQEAGFKDRQVIHDYAAKAIFEPDVVSLNDLTTAQANQVIAQLESDYPPQ